MSKLVSSILDRCNNSEKRKLNILIYEFDISTEIAISKTGHNIYRINLSDTQFDNLPENFVILPHQQVLYCFDYDLIIFKNGTMNREFLDGIQQQLRLPCLIIDENINEMREGVAFTTKSDANSDDFVDEWTKLLDKFEEVYLT
jgi:hypothetical protein